MTFDSDTFVFSGGGDAGLRSDGELVQAVHDRDVMEDHDHKDWIDLLSMGGGGTTTQHVIWLEDATVANLRTESLGHDEPAVTEFTDGGLF